MGQEEDRHFYIDNASPDEVLHIVKALSADNPASRNEIVEAVQENYGMQFQKKHEFSFRRVEDLGLSNREKKGSSHYYVSNEATRKLQEIAGYDVDFSYELLHYLHYTRYDGETVDRKLLWTYRECCNYIWYDEKRLDVNATASALQSQMLEEFPHLAEYVNEEKGMRIDGRGVQEVLKWLGMLQPSPFDEDGQLQPRHLDNYHLVLLALDDFYRHEGYAYDIALLLDDDALDKVARVFFMDTSACRELIPIAAAISDAISLSDTLAGTAITLHTPYGIENL